MVEFLLKKESPLDIPDDVRILVCNLLKHYILTSSYVYSLVGLL